MLKCFQVLAIKAIYRWVMLGCLVSDDTQLHDLLVKEGYLFPRKLPNGEWLALKKMLYTTGLFIIENKTSWRTRWCYENHNDALAALVYFDGVGDPPGPWIKQKPEDRLNPEWARTGPNENAKR